MFDGTIKPGENILDSSDIPFVWTHPNRIRSFAWDKNSKRLSRDKLTTINGITVFYEPGSTYHAIICALLTKSNQFCPWNELIKAVKEIVISHRSKKSWTTFVNKKHVKNYKMRIRENAHILTRKGKNCFGYRLHKTGCGIYYFKDGAMIKTNGAIHFDHNSNYDVLFSDGCSLQKRYRGRILTYGEYLHCVQNKYITPSCDILNNKCINKFKQHSLIFGFDENCSFLYDSELPSVIVDKLNVGQINVTEEESQFLLWLLNRHIIADT